MTDATAPSPPAHVSYSQLSSWLRCGKAYELERVIHVPSIPTWAQVAGSAVHSATERIDRGDASPIRDLWLDVFAETIELEAERTGYAPDEWRATGRRTKVTPRGEDYRFWKSEGAMTLNRWKAWRIANKDQWQIASLPNPDGSGDTWDGIELPMVIHFGDIAVQAVLDRLFVDPDGDMLVVDIKSGAWAPKDQGQQLGLYAAGIEQMFSLRPKTGAYWMGRAGDFPAPPQDLSRFSQHYWNLTVSQLAKAKAEGIFLPNPGMFCGSCSVRDYCATVGGSRAHLADSLASTLD